MTVRKQRFGGLDVTKGLCHYKAEESDALSGTDFDLYRLLFLCVEEVVLENMIYSIYLSDESHLTELTVHSQTSMISRSDHHRQPITIHAFIIQQRCETAGEEDGKLTSAVTLMKRKKKKKDACPVCCSSRYRSKIFHFARIYLLFSSPSLSQEQQAATGWKGSHMDARTKSLSRRLRQPHIV